MLLSSPAGRTKQTYCFTTVTVSQPYLPLRKGHQQRTSLLRNTKSRRMWRIFLLCGSDRCCSTLGRPEGSLTSDLQCLRSGCSVVEPGNTGRLCDWSIGGGAGPETKTPNVNINMTAFPLLILINIYLKLTLFLNDAHISGPFHDYFEYIS